MPNIPPVSTKQQRVTRFLGSPFLFGEVGVDEHAQWVRKNCLEQF
ncbi:MAG: hypothetical protein OEY89_08140 [Gammaproteobacteria bacterium]|nr:hypothetical protein [Gammaproteobacteria bacterium]